MTELQPAGNSEEKKKAELMARLLGKVSASAGERMPGTPESKSESSGTSPRRGENPKNPEESRGKLRPDLKTNSPESERKPQTERDIKSAELDTLLDEKAVNRYGENFGDLGSDSERLKVLADVLEKDTTADAKLLREKLINLSERFEQPASPEEWVAIRQELGEIPDELFNPENDSKEAVILGKALPEVFDRVAENLSSYGLDENQVDVIARSLHYAVHDEVVEREIGHYDTSTLTDNNLIETVKKYNDKIDFALTTGSDEEVLIKEYQELAKEMRDGIFERPDPKDPTKKLPAYNKSEAAKVAEAAEKQIKELEKTIQRGHYGRQGIESIKTTTTGEKFFNTVETIRGRFTMHDYKEIENHYKTLSSEEQENFIAKLRKDIHEIAGELERDDQDPWRIGGIETLPMQLQENILILNRINRHEGRTMLSEIQGRIWLHAVAHAVNTSASPQEAKEFLIDFARLHEITFFDSLFDLPGAGEGYMLLEQYGERLMQAEMRGDREDVLHEIEHQVDVLLASDPKTRTDVTGVTGEHAVRVAERLWMVNGRDATYYNKFIHDNNLIDYVTRRMGDGTEYSMPILKKDAPMFWNFFRLLYCPEAQWTFFQIGSNLEGAEAKLWRKGEPFQVKAGRGVGADVIRVLRENKWSLDIRDFHSRRFYSGYMTDAWGRQIFAKDYEGPYKLSIPEIAGNLPADANSEEYKTQYDKHKQKLHEIWYGASAFDVEGKVDRSAFRDLEQQYVGAKVAENFAKELAHGSVEWLGVDGGSWKKLVSTARAEAKGDGAKLKIIDALDRKYQAMDAEAKAYNAKFKNLDKNGKESVGVEKFMDLSQINLREFRHKYLLRGPENARGNLRDHISAYTPFQATTSFINNPSVANLQEAGNKDSMTSYTTPGAFQTRFMSPIMQAFAHVHRGRLPFGNEIFAIPATRSLYGRVYEQNCIDDAAMYGLFLDQVQKGNLDMDQVKKIRGGKFWIPMHLFDKARHEINLSMGGIVLFGAVQKELEKIEKESQGH